MGTDTLTERKTITLWLAVNELGESRMSWDSAEEAVEDLRDNDGFEAVRVVQINTTIDLPFVETVNVGVTVPPQQQSPAQVSVA